MALTDNLVAYYKLDGNSNDSVGSNNGTDGYITYNASYGKINQGALLAGTQDTALGTNSRIVISPITLGSNFTIAAWVKLPSSGNYAIIYSNRDGSTQTPKWMNISVLRTAIEAELNGGGGSGNYQNVSSATTVLGDGNYHFCVWKITSNTELKMYIDNNLISTTTIPNYTRDNSLITSIGAYKWGGGAGEYHYTNGNLDEIGFWTASLTNDQLTQLYNSGDGLQYPFTTANTSNFFNFF